MAPFGVIGTSGAHSQSDMPAEGPRMGRAQQASNLEPQMHTDKALLDCSGTCRALALGLTEFGYEALDRSVGFAALLELREMAGIGDDFDLDRRQTRAEHVEIGGGLAGVHRAALAFFVAVGRLQSHDRDAEAGQRR